MPFIFEANQTSFIHLLRYVSCDSDRVILDDTMTTDDTPNYFTSQPVARRHKHGGFREIDKNSRLHKVSPPVWGTTLVHCMPLEGQRGIFVGRYIYVCDIVGSVLFGVPQRFKNVLYFFV